jgi:hypothetical protein
MMLQMEISQEIISRSEPEIRLNLADDVMRLLNVRERNAEMSKDWLIFISSSNFKVTAGEIYLAFKMALSREILDTNGKEIDLYPELSNNMTGKVISAYLKHKNESLRYQLSKDKLKSLKTPKNEFSESQKQELRESLLKLIFNEVKQKGFSDVAWQLYSDLELAGKINPTKEEKSKMYQEQLRIYEFEEKKRIKTKFKHADAIPHINQLLDKVRGKPLESVKNTCRSIVVSDHLKPFTTDYETFKSKL